jgi:hypothetical protein
MSAIRLAGWPLGLACLVVAVPFAVGVPSRCGAWAGLAGPERYALRPRQLRGGVLSVTRLQEGAV